MTERQHRTDSRADLDKLEAVYKRFEALPLSQIAEPPPERPSEAAADPWYDAKEIAVRLTRFVVLCLRTWGAKPEQIYFAVELASLNVFNAKDSPVSAEKRDEAREAAYRYYMRSLPNVPEQNTE